MNYTSKKEQICQSPSNIHLHFEMIPRVKQNQINVCTWKLSKMYIDIVSHLWWRIEKVLKSKWGCNSNKNI